MLTKYLFLAHWSLLALVILWQCCWVMHLVLDSYSRAPFSIWYNKDWHKFNQMFWTGVYHHLMERQYQHVCDCTSCCSKFSLHKNKACQRGDCRDGFTILMLVNLHIQRHYIYFSPIWHFICWIKLAANVHLKSSMHKAVPQHLRRTVFKAIENFLFQLKEYRPSPL